MCTLLMAIGLFDDTHIFAIDNRDEVLDRPAEPPSVHRREGMEIFAPRDLEAGGTWLGLNAAGVYGAVTNRFRQSSEPHHRSRGELVFRALQKSSAAEGADLIAGLDPSDYAGFHLALADEQGLNLLWNDGECIHRSEHGPGVYVLTERSFGAAPSQRLDRLQERIAQVPADPDEARALMREWMIEHDEDNPLESTCVHLEGQNYGTRSSTIVEVGQTWHFAHADGAPCSAAYKSYDDQVQALRRLG